MAAPVATEGALNEEDILARWPAFVSAVAHEKQSLASALEEATVNVFPHAIVLGFTKSFNQQLVTRSAEILKPFLIKNFGQALTLETRIEAAPASAAPAAPAPAHFVHQESIELKPNDGPSFEEVAPDKTGAEVQNLLKHFPGKVKVERKNA